MEKTIYFIRHGTALHNINYKTMGESAFTTTRDTPLVEKGISDAKLLNSTWINKDNIELIIVSPLTRTLDTANIIFDNHPAPIIALDCLKEHPQSHHICNRMSDKDCLIAKFPRIDFSNISQEDLDWSDNIKSSHIESILIEKRINILKEWLRNREEKTIAVVGHNSYFNMILNGRADYNIKTELKHCYPYEVTFNIKELNL
jgi:broad specificity phosphatase PhoE